VRPAAVLGRAGFVGLRLAVRGPRLSEISVCLCLCLCATGLAARSRLGDRVRAAKSAVGGLSIVISRRRAARELEA